MKTTLIICAFLMASLGALAQEQSNSNAKWKETTDGVTYQMSAQLRGIVTKNVEKPHITLNFKGHTELLSKVVLSKKDQPQKNIPIAKGGQNIDVEPGHYLFQFHHQKMGLQEFEVDLKRNDYKEMVVTLD